MADARHEEVKRLRALLRETISLDSIIAGEDTIGCSCAMIVDDEKSTKNMKVFKAPRCQGTCLRSRIEAELADG